MPAMERISAFNLRTAARQNILELEPYRCARDDYEDNGSLVLLDANENAHDPKASLSAADGPVNGNGNGGATSSETIAGLNRYPDPRQDPLKQLLCDLRNTQKYTDKALTPANLFLGVGSDEAIDALIRAFCRPGTDKILTCPPTYSMYGVSAKINDVQVLKIPRRTEDGSFGLDIPAITAALSTDPTIKIIYLDSPGNPSGALLAKSDIEAILQHPSYNGIIAIDEAYIDFARDPAASLAGLVTEHPNLCVLQTLSKAFGLAAIRLGACFTDPAIALLLNKLKAPYNISGPTSRIASNALSARGLDHMRATLALLESQKARMLADLPGIPGVGPRVGGSDGNWLMYRVLDARGRPCNATALAVHERLARGSGGGGGRRGIVTRFRGRDLGCDACLRITVGTEEEVSALLAVLGPTIQEVWDAGVELGAKRRKIGEEEEEEEEEEIREVDANAVVA